MMKYSIIIITALFAMFAAEGISQNAELDQFTVQVDGLGCPFCAYGLEKKFKEFKSIDDVNIEMETGVFTFSYPAHEGLTLTQVEQQVEAAGYTAVDVKVLRGNGEDEQLMKKEEPVVGAISLESSIRVDGNCGMCAARINKAANSTEGVINAEWDKDSKLLKVTFDETKTSLLKIAEEVSASGHDNELSAAKDSIYNGLPGCCQYDRS